MENKNHWRRDPTLANLALIRSVNLRLLTELATDEWAPAKNEPLAAHPDQALNLVRSK